jgi:hypothetical protein
MKQLVILFCSFFLSAYCYAQSYNDDIVYLKNGSIIRGVVIELTPNQSLKIKTADGSLFVYNVSDVEKIAKEELPAIEPKANDHVGVKSLRGYKGFVDVGATFAVDEFADDDEDRIEVNTCHGYQFNNHIFLGAGVGYHDYKYYAIPIFTNFRANFIKRKVTPFVDVRSGYSFGDLEGLYGCVGMGARFGLAKKRALNIILGYSFQECEIAYDYYDSDYGYGYREISAMIGFTLKFGFEF